LKEATAVLWRSHRADEVRAEGVFPVQYPASAWHSIPSSPHQPLHQWGKASDLIAHKGAQAFPKLAMEDSMYCYQLPPPSVLPFANQWLIFPGLMDIYYQHLETENREEFT
jgi:hypothetical protein